jgi:hypothetical protein
MTTQEAVDRGLEIVAKVDELKNEFKTIVETLCAAALDGDQVDLVDPEREGKQFIATGTAKTVPVVITADMIVQSFTDGTPVHARMEAVAGDKLPLFYQKKTTWEILAKSGKAFRLEAAGLLEEKAPAFITAALSRDKLGIPKNQIKIEWERAEDLKPEN